MTDNYRSACQPVTSAISAWTKMAGSLALMAAFAIVSTLTWPAVSQEQSLGMLQFVASGPIQIEVHDPEGNVVSRDAIEIDGASFQDVDDEITIEIPHRVLGDYLVHMNVDGSANRLQHFYLSISDGVETIQLADFQLIVNAPHDPYVIRSSADGFEDVTRALAEQEEDSSSSSLVIVWILAGCAGLLVGMILVIRRRKRRQ